MSDLRLALASALLLAVSVPAAADIIVFTDEGAFLGATGGLGFESFEDTEPGFTGTSRFLDGFIVGGGGSFASPEIIDNPLFAFHGDQSIGNTQEISFFVFDEAPNAFGFTVYDFGNAGTNSLFLVLSDSSGEFATVNLATDQDPFEEFRFFGILSDRPFTDLVIRHDNVEDFLTVDAVHFGRSVIPEPTTFLLLGVGLVGCALRRLRYRGSGLN